MPSPSEAKKKQVVIYSVSSMSVVQVTKLDDPKLAVEAYVREYLSPIYGENFKIHERTDAGDARYYTKIIETKKLPDFADFDDERSYEDAISERCCRNFAFFEVKVVAILPFLK